MNLAAYATLLISLLLSLFLGGAALASSWGGRPGPIRWLERGHLVITALITLSSLILFQAFLTHDFSFKYVAEYSDQLLPTFYSVTAFWAGQEGSLLFWAWMTVLLTAVLTFTPAYRSLSGHTKTWFWLFHFIVTAFFMLLLSCWSNPFIQLQPTPADGQGLNPLLQNPGMIFHPPLLFLGYAGFTIPACLGLGQLMSPTSPLGGDKTESTWLEASRNFTLIAWLFLTAGIVLGGWWSYMELGWGGYWAWDPVENASLIPWFAATAFLHTGVIQNRRGGMKQANVFLASLTLLMAFFGTYLVRSGVIESLHAFGSGGVGTPLLIFILLGLGLTLFILWFGRSVKPVSKPLGALISREGFLVITTWALLILGLVILMGTMWPVISKIWNPTPKGLDAGFYNLVCLPFFVLIALLLMFCPWLNWKGGLREKLVPLGLVVVFAGLAAWVWLTYGVEKMPSLHYSFGDVPLPLAPLGAAAALACVVGIVLLIFRDPGVRRVRPSWAAYGVHLGLALVVLGVAFSGPYKVEKDALLLPGESMTVGEYTLTHDELFWDKTPAMEYIEARLTVTKDGEVVGKLTPQRRVYAKFPENIYAEVSTIFTLGNELYATLLGMDENEAVSLRVSTNPLVNWIWIGGTLMSLFPFLGLARLKRKKAAQA